MADLAHKITDAEIEKIERKLRGIYKRASKEIGEKVDKYFASFAELDQKKLQLVQSGAMSEADYIKWRKGKILVGKRWQSMQKQIAERLTKADQEAINYVNGRLADIYVLNYNAFATDITKAIKGRVSFELVNEDAVKNLVLTNDTLLPYKMIDGKKAVRWHTQRLNAEITQGILQGESIPKIAKRLSQNLGMTANGSAVRNARTAVTSAENRGRLDMLHSAREKGVIVEKQWSAIHDGRTREAHAEIDGVTKDIDEPFTNSLGDIMYPGDPDADPANTYNCRCCILKKVVGFVKR